MGVEMTGSELGGAVVTSGSIGAVRAVLGAGVVGSVVSLCLFGDCEATRDSRAVGGILGDVGAALADPGMQWMVMVWAGMYLIAFVILRRRLAAHGRIATWRKACLSNEVWLAGLVAVAALAYALYYAQAIKPTEALVLLGGATLGQGVAVWTEWGNRIPKSKVQSPKLGRGTVVGLLIILLTTAAVCQAETTLPFQYRGQARWSGPWKNPNAFGVLMGVGVVLAVGRLVQSLKSKVQRPSSVEGGVPRAEWSSPEIHLVLFFCCWLLAFCSASLPSAEWR
jgi:hypothetical protein